MVESDLSLTKNTQIKLIVCLSQMVQVF